MIKIFTKYYYKCKYDKFRAKLVRLIVNDSRFFEHAEFHRIGNLNFTTTERLVCEFAFVCPKSNLEDALENVIRHIKEKYATTARITITANAGTSSVSVVGYIPFYKTKQTLKKDLINKNEDVHQITLDGYNEFKDKFMFSIHDSKYRE